LDVSNLNNNLKKRKATGTQIRGKRGRENRERGGEDDKKRAALWQETAVRGHFRWKRIDRLSQLEKRGLKWVERSRAENDEIGRSPFKPRRLKKKRVGTRVASDLLRKKKCISRNQAEQRCKRTYHLKGPKRYESGGTETERNMG